MGTFQRIVTISPAFDGRPGGPPEWRTPRMKDGEDYGYGSCEIAFILKGELGSVQFRILTDWYPPHVHTRVGGRQPIGRDLRYHSPVPLYEGQRQMCGPGECPYVPEGQPCYYDRPSLAADEVVMQALLPKGSDGVWERLEEVYRETFEESDDDP